MASHKDKWYADGYRAAMVDMINAGEREGASGMLRWLQDNAGVENVSRADRVARSVMAEILGEEPDGR